jgi:transcriptional regulator with XRE-family HTH domain
MLVSGQPRSLEPGLADGGYTFFGRFFDRLLESRGFNQSTFAAECRRRKFRVGRPGKQRDIGQRSISDWMRGYAACPREIPTYADAILILSDQEWNDFGVAYAYGQTVPEEDFEDLLEFRKFYRVRLAEGSLEESEDRSKKG